MRSIWKFGVGEGPVEMPVGAEIIKVDMQGANIVVWAIVDPEAPKQKRAIIVLGTGFERQNKEMASLKYLDTVFDGSFVWHIFDGGPV